MEKIEFRIHPIRGSADRAEQFRRQLRMAMTDLRYYTPATCSLLDFNQDKEDAMSKSFDAAWRPSPIDALAIPPLTNPALNPNPWGIEQFVPKPMPLPPVQNMLPIDPAARKSIPIGTGFVDYFPDAMAAVAELSRIGNDQHNPGKPLHWDRSKSGDESDALMRHFLERGTIDIDGVRHSAKLAWRAMALLQKEIEGTMPRALA
jgi:hypothetical protein